jgi:hypothetical protein
MRDSIRARLEEKIPFNEQDLIPATQEKSPGLSRGWADVVGTGAKAASQALQQQQQRAASLAQVKEQKRRRIAEMLAKAFKRDSSLSQLGIEQGDENADYQSQAIQDVARGFADTFRRG